MKKTFFVFLMFFVFCNFLFSQSNTEKGRALIGFWGGEFGDFFIFESNLEFSSGIVETGGGRSGRWRISGNDLILNVKNAGYEDVSYIEVVGINIINDNNIFLTFEDGYTSRLVRYKSIEDYFKYIFNK